MAEIALRRHTAAIDIYRVVDCLERVKGNADRQNDAQSVEPQGHAECAQYFIQRLQKEVSVLEVSQNAEIDKETQDQEDFSSPRRRAALHAQGEEIVHHGCRTDEQSQPGVPHGVEIEAGG